MGNVLQAGEGQAPTRQALLGAGLDATRSQPRPTQRGSRDQAQTLQPGGVGSGKGSTPTTWSTTDHGGGLCTLLPH